MNNTPKTWITADWHLGEDRFDLMSRPFTSQMEMVDTLIGNHNKRVKPEDTVIVVGDVCYQKTPDFLRYVEQFNGKKVLVRGNHDRVFTDEQLKPYFQDIVPEGESMILSAGEIDCNVVHYPSLASKHYFNLVGHIHAAWKYQLNCFNIGVDANHFCPVDLEKDVPFAFKAIGEFYDADVWCAYAEANASYYPTRGKKSSYLDVKP